MIQKCDSALIMDTTHPVDEWCVFEHQVVLKEGEPPTVILIGACKLGEVYRLMDGKTNTEWCKIFKTGGSVMVRIVATTSNKGEAMRYAQDLVRTIEPTPICNKQGFNLRGTSRAVRCLNNDTRYNTQHEACLALGLHQSAMSRHLRGELSHVGGMRFVYDVPRMEDVG